jgi:hypothetical protein
MAILPNKRHKMNRLTVPPKRQHVSFPPARLLLTSTGGLPDTSLVRRYTRPPSSPATTRHASANVPLRAGAARRKMAMRAPA